MNELIPRFQSGAHPLQSSSLPLPHFKDTSGEKLQNIQHYRLFQDCHRVPAKKQKVFLQLFVLKLVLFAVKRFLMSFVLLLPGLAFVSHPTTALPVYFSSVCVIPLRFFLPLLLHPVFTFAVGSNRGA